MEIAGLHQQWAESMRDERGIANGARPLPLRNSEVGQVLPCMAHDRIAQTTCRTLKGMIIGDDNAHRDAWTIGQSGGANDGRRMGINIVG